MPERTTRTRRMTKVGFDTTNWTMVMKAVDNDLPGSRQALEQLCQTYWRPVYSFLRQQSHPAEEAQDLTQGFFLHLLQGGRLGRIHPSKGRLRSFLLAALQNFVQNQRDWARAQKRGGGLPPIPIDSVEPLDRSDPAAAFDAQWAKLLFERAMEQLRAQCATAEKGRLLEAAKGFLTADSERGDYVQLARDLGMNEIAARTAVSRLRAQFREILREEVGRTVAAAGEAEEELRYLLGLAGTD